jgi:hypothetical protein
MEKTNNKKRILLGGIILVALLAILGAVYFKFGPKVFAGKKEIVIEVVNSEGQSTEYQLKTNEEYLKQAMEELAKEDSSFSFSGTDSEYGLMIEEINGQRAVFAEDNAYWALYVNGDYGQYGADQQVVADGDVYSWKYEVSQ